MLLANRTAVISGAASARGIGRATAELFAEHGARVAILDIDGDGAAAAAASLGPGHLGIFCDVTNPESCRAAAAAVLDSFGHLDILINNAGITEPLKIMEITPANWQRVLDVNLAGVLHLSQAFIPHMRSRRQGSIACMSSVSAQRGGEESSAARTTQPPRRACSGSRRRWRANSGPMAYASTASRLA